MVQRQYQHEIRAGGQQEVQQVRLGELADGGVETTFGKRGLLLAAWKPAAIFLFFFLAHLGLYNHFGAQWTDDAYITFRYSERIAAGKGFTFNDGEKAVLGTTTPLWTLLVAGARWAGIGLKPTVMLFTSLAAAAWCLACWRIATMFGYGYLGVIAALALLVYEIWLWIFLMGMETVLYMALISWILERIISRRPTGVGVLGALAILTRPDGAVAVALGLAAAWMRGKRPGVRESGFCFLGLLPWIVYATLVFGSPIPHSIQAKQWIHQAGFRELIGSDWAFLWKDLFGKIAIALGVLGLVMVAARRRQAWAIPAWIALYSLGLACSGIMIRYFWWYMAPLLAVLWMLGMIGLGEAGAAVAERFERARRAVLGCRPRIALKLVTIGLLVAIAAQCSSFIRTNWRAFPPGFTRKERLYLEVAGQMRSNLPPGTTILVGEVGVFGQALPGCRIIDSAGLNSPRMLALRRADRQSGRESFPKGIPRWLRDAVAEFKPDYIASLASLIGGETAFHVPAALPGYELVFDQPTAFSHFIILRRL